MKASLKETEDAEDLIYDDFRKGNLDESAYKRQIERVRKERRHLADIIGRAHEDVTGAALVTAKKILELSRMAPELYQRATPQERRDLLAKILSNPVLDGTSVRYELKKPFRIVSEMASSSDWGGLSDSNR